MSRSTIPAEMRRIVAENFRHRCAYCQTQESIVGSHFTADHIIPESLGGPTVVENLCLACWDCNLIKRTLIAALDPIDHTMVSLFNPNQQSWQEHFAWSGNGALLVGLTTAGRATIAALRLNRPLLVQARRRWIKAGWHPPEDE